MQTKSELSASGFVCNLAFKPFRLENSILLNNLILLSFHLFPNLSNKKSSSFQSMSCQTYLSTAFKIPSHIEKISFPSGSIGSLKSAFLIDRLSFVGGLYRKVDYPEVCSDVKKSRICNPKFRISFFLVDVSGHIKIRDKFFLFQTIRTKFLIFMAKM